jgi:hypothetical protein
MKLSSLIAVLFTAFLVVGCSSPQDRAYKAQEKVHKERLRLIDDYQKCIAKAGEDAAKRESCEQYLRAADALK